MHKVIEADTDVELAGAILDGCRHGRRLRTGCGRCEVVEEFMEGTRKSRRTQRAG